MIRIPCSAFAVVVALLLWSSQAPAQGKKGGAKKGGAEVFKVDDKLTTSDPKDKIRKSCHAKLHIGKLEPGSYTIDLVSNDFDAYLRVEDAMGKELAKDDDKGGDFNARILFKVDEANEYRLVVTTASRGETGQYKLTVTKQKDDKK